MDKLISRNYSVINILYKYFFFAYYSSKNAKYCLLPASQMRGFAAFSTHYDSKVSIFGIWGCWLETSNFKTSPWCEGSCDGHFSYFIMDGTISNCEQIPQIKGRDAFGMTLNNQLYFSLKRLWQQLFADQVFTMKNSGVCYLHTTATAACQKALNYLSYKVLPRAPVACSSSFNVLTHAVLLWRWHIWTHVAFDLKQQRPFTKESDMFQDLNQFQLSVNEIFKYI